MITVDLTRLGVRLPDHCCPVVLALNDVVVVVLAQVELEKVKKKSPLKMLNVRCFVSPGAWCGPQKRSLAITAPSASATCYVKVIQRVLRPSHKEKRHLLDFDTCTSCELYGLMKHNQKS